MKEFTMQYQRFVLLVIVLIKLVDSSIGNSIATSLYYYENQSHTSKLLSQENTSPETDDNELPLEFYEQNNNETDMPDFVNMDNIGPALDKLHEDLKRDVGREIVIKAKPVPCRTRYTTVTINVELKQNDTIYRPECIRIHRCSGCSDVATKSCQPRKTQLIYYQVQRLEKGIWNDTFIPMLNHTKCGIQCIIKEADCKPGQDYDSTSCKCNCIDTDEQRECQNDNLRYWDPEQCRCLCSEREHCNPGQTFLESTCKCVSIHMTPQRENKLQEYST